MSNWITGGGGNFSLHPVQIDSEAQPVSLLGNKAALSDYWSTSDIEVLTA